MQRSPMHGLRMASVNRFSWSPPIMALTMWRCGIKLPDQSLNVERLLPSFSTVYQGIVRGVFRQQAGGAWFPCKTLKIFVTVIMPQSSDPHHWFAAVGSREGSWPMELPNPRPLLRRVSLRTFSRMRKRTLTPHLWYKLVPNWSAGHTWLHLETPTVVSGRALDYSGTYVLVLRVSLRLFNLDCRYPRDLLQPARENLETPTVETETQLRAKFETRNNQNLVDRFAKPHERAAYTPQWRAAQTFMARLKGLQLPVFDLHVDDFLASVAARDAERNDIRMHLLEAHVNMAVWRDEYGRLWRRKR